MSAEVRAMKTAAESGLAESFAAAKAGLPGAPAVAALREDAFRRFDVQGLPHRRVEEWKYTDLRALMRDAKPLAPPPDKAARSRASAAGAALAFIEARRIVFVDGAYVPELSDLADLEPGLSIGSMARHWRPAMRWSSASSASWCRPRMPPSRSTPPSWGTVR
jgi:Fe-S cluster assembly protein SufD